MFQKISTADDIKGLQKGSFIILYPLSFVAQDEIDLSDEKNFTLFEITDVEIDKQLLTLTVPKHDFVIPALVQEIRGGSLFTIQKQAREIINESLWWFRQHPQADMTLQVPGEI